jgi:hypothetical protein
MPVTAMDSLCVAMLRLAGDTQAASLPYSLRPKYLVRLGYSLRRAHTILSPI